MKTDNYSEGKEGKGEFIYLLAAHVVAWSLFAAVIAWH